MTYFKVCQIFNNYYNYYKFVSDSNSDSDVFNATFSTKKKSQFYIPI